MLFSHVIKTERTIHSTMQKKKWIDSATVILSAPNEPSTYKCDYRVLLLKRSSKSSFFANNYVFPGGAVDKADSSNRWFNVFQSLDKRFVTDFQQLKVSQTDSYRPPIFNTDDSEKLYSVPKEVSLRICALREMFEESGIFLSLRSYDDLINRPKRRCGSVFDFKSMADTELWRKRVHNNASAFLDMCLTLKCVPDIWSLYEWSNWLTPSEAIVKFKKRYDTVFYKAFVDGIPRFSRHDNQETTEMVWHCPEHIIQSSWKKEIQLGPPQIYELSRLLNFSHFQDLVSFTIERSLKGMERWLPVMATTEDKELLMVYPGDRFYPEDCRFSDEGKPFLIPHTYLEIVNKKPKQLNHARLMKNRQYIAVSQYSPPYGHIKAIDLSSYRDSKL